MSYLRSSTLLLPPYRLGRNTCRGLWRTVIGTMTNNSFPFIPFDAKRMKNLYRKHRGGRTHGTRPEGLGGMG